METLKRAITLITLTLIVLTTSAYAYQFEFSCPPASSIIIQKNTEPSAPEPYVWLSPAVNAPVNSSNYAPLNADRVTGSAIAAKVNYTSTPSMYSLLCFYPANATTKKSWDLPAMTGYIFYRIYNAQPNTCQVKGIGFICDAR